MGKHRSTEMRIANERVATLRRETWYTVRGGRARQQYWSNHSDAYAYAQKVGGTVFPEHVLLVPGLSGKAWPLAAEVADSTYFEPILATPVSAS